MPDSADYVAKLEAEVEWLRAHLLRATEPAASDRALTSLHRSGVVGLNEDGSVWVYGGLPVDGTPGPVWKKDERYATADSPMAETMRRALIDGSQEGRIDDQ